MYRDVIVLAADVVIAATMDAVLRRPKSLGIRPVTFDVAVHPERDAGCFHKAHEFLRSQCSFFQHALVIFDREGCGAEGKPRQEIEYLVNSQLSRNGWDGRARTIVIDPEIENWIWVDSPHFRRTAGWTSDQKQLYRWLNEQGYRISDTGKPDRPQMAWEQLLRKTNTARSSAHFRFVASNASLRSCRDQAFIDLREQLQNWFT